VIYELFDDGYIIGQDTENIEMEWVEGILPEKGIHLSEASEG